MARNITVTFDDGSTHVYQNAPDNLTPDMVQQRAQQDFGKSVTSLDGGKSASPVAGKGMLGQRQGTLAKIGTGLASLADTTVGGVLPMIGQGVQAVARPFTTPQQAEQIGGVVSSALDKPFGKAFGVTDQPAYKQEASRQVMDFIGQNVGKGADWLSQKTGLPVEDVRNMLGTSMLAAPAVIKTVAPVVSNALTAIPPVAQNALATARATPLGKAIEAPIAARATKIQEANVAQSYQNAGRIEAANKGSGIGLVASPAAMNPTKTNQAKAFLTDPKAIDAAAAEANAVQVPKLALNEMGLPANTALNSEAPFAAAREAASGPYKEVAKLPSMTAAPDVVKTVESLRPSKLVLGKDRAAALNEIIDTSIQDMSNGLTGAETVKSISDLRAQAQSINNSQKAGHPISASELDKVNAYRGIADALEQMLEDNVKDPKALNELRDARIKIAKIHAYEDATDFNTGKINPAQLAKATAENSKLTGDIATIGQFAGNFPEAMGLTTPEAAASAVKRTLSRATLSGAAGAALGSIIPGVGSAVGLAAGAGLGELGSRVMAKRMVSPSYQTANAIPKDYRSIPVKPTNALVTVPPEVFGPSDAGNANKLRIVSYDANGVPIYMADEPGQGFTMPSSPSFGAAPSPYAQRALPNEIPQQIYRAQKNAELAQEFRAAAERKPAGRGTPLVFDSAGNLVEAPPAGVGSVVGAPTSLESAVKKLSGIVVPETQTTYKTQTISPKTGTKPYTRITKKEGETTFERGVSQAFDLTSEERIAWNKSKADLAVASPELKGLTDKAIAEKMMDRQWVSDTIGKIREKAQAFDEISKRASTAQAARDASMKREQMMDLLADLEDSLRPARPVQKGGQGPKTRAFQRNMLTPEQEIQNALVK
jgi:hypothetical protein